jgi:hypothetical protein
MRTLPYLFELWTSVIVHVLEFFPATVMRPMSTYSSTPSLFLAIKERLCSLLARRPP